MNERGVIYMCWGRKAIDEAVNSMNSLWKHAAGMPVFVVGDLEAKDAFKGNNKVMFRYLDIDPFRDIEFLAGRVKPKLYGVSPFDMSLYVDADTDFAASPDRAFDMLADWDFIVAETQGRTLAESIAGIHETEYSRKWFGTPHILYHNSGMLFWRRNEQVERLFDLWSEEWHRFAEWDEQVALLRALALSEAVFLTVPYTWNCRFAANTILLHHRFGTRSAWKFKRTRGAMMTADELRGRAAILRKRNTPIARPVQLTGAEVRKRKLETKPIGHMRKPTHTARDKRIKEPERNKELANVRT